MRSNDARVSAIQRKVVQLKKESRMRTAAIAACLVLVLSASVYNGFGRTEVVEDSDVPLAMFVPAPENLALEGGVLTWSPVEGADQYVVTVDGVEQTVNGCSLEIGEGKEIRVRAIEDGVEGFEAVLYEEAQDSAGAGE